jgi:hypothetical protein
VELEVSLVARVVSVPEVETAKSILIRRTGAVCMKRTVHLYVIEI